MPKQYRDLENVVVNLPCATTKADFQGSSWGQETNDPISLELTGADLCQNTMFVGTLGSGKTTSMNTMLQQLISYRSLEAKHKLGLFIIDSKLDETCQKVTEWAKRAGRLDDLIIVSPTGDYYYELFRDCETLSKVEELATKLLSCSGGCGKDNQFWEDSRRPIILMGLVLAMVGDRLTFTKALKALQSSIIEGNTEVEDAQLEALVQMAASSILSEANRNIINQVTATYKMWSELDPKTKATHKQVFSNNLQPLLSSQAQSYFLADGGTGSPARQPLDVQHVISDGKIVVVSVNAVRYPELASLLGKLIKADFYDAVQARQLAFNDDGRLVGLILDEYPLVVTGTQGRYGDVAQLQSMRSKRAFVVAATQGFTSLDLVVGNDVREGLTLNFNNWFIMKSNESDVRYFVEALLPKPKVIKNFDWDPDDPIDNSIKPSNLAVNQAYVALTRLRAYDKPLWLRPTYYDGKILETITATEMNFYDALDKLKLKNKDGENPKPSEEHVLPPDTNVTGSELKNYVEATPLISDLSASRASDPFHSQIMESSLLVPALLKPHLRGLWTLIRKLLFLKTTEYVSQSWHVYLVSHDRPEVVSSAVLQAMIKNKIVTAKTPVSVTRDARKIEAGAIPELTKFFQAAA